MFSAFYSYPTFMVFVAVFLSVLFTIVFMPPFIRFLRSRTIGQQVRADGPESHLVKQGTPTMGGLIMLLATLLTVILLAPLSPEVVLVLVATLLVGVLGLIDDASKVIKERSLGLTPKAKLIGQFSIAALFCLGAVNWIGIEPTIEIPLVYTFDLGILTTTLPIETPTGDLRIPWLYLIFVTVLIAGLSNATNLTDGLDGLAAGTSMIVFFAMAAIAFRCNMFGSAIIAAALVGCCIGFLWYNSYPADIFMGDTGSLALGTALGCLAVVTKTEVVSLVIGGLFIIETLSVMIQVLYFKKTRKRIFLMAPLHHHFEKKGWSEVKVVVRFYIIAAAFTALGFAWYFASTLVV